MYELKWKTKDGKFDVSEGFVYSHRTGQEIVKSLNDYVGDEVLEYYMVEAPMWGVYKVGKNGRRTLLLTFPTEQQAEEIMFFNNSTRKTNCYNVFKVEEGINKV